MFIQNDQGPEIWRLNDMSEIRGKFENKCQDVSKCTKNPNTHPTKCRFINQCQSFVVSTDLCLEPICQKDRWYVQ